MMIALDHDKTYTLDPLFWDQFIEAAKARGHEVVCVTQRYPLEKAAVPCEIVYTSREPKGNYMAGLHRLPDIWIDDKPQGIFVYG